MQICGVHPGLTLKPFIISAIAFYAVAVGFVPPAKSQCLAPNQWAWGNCGGGGGGSGGGGGTNWGAAIGLGGAILGILGGMGSSNRSYPPGSVQCGNGRYCQAGFACVGNNQCLSLASPRMCSNGRSYCGSDSICIKGNQCLPLDSVRVCGNGSDYCGAGAMCTNENRCLSLSSASVCRNGRSYCSTDSICIEGNKCLPLSSERVCRDGRSHCGEGFRCNDEDQCVSTAVVEEAPPDIEAAPPRSDEDNNLTEQPPPKVDEAVPNPFSQFRQADADAGCRQDANSSSDITGGSSSGSSTTCGAKPNPFTSVKLVAVNAPVTNPFSALKEGSPDPSPPCDGSTIPCVSIPGWSGEERYNHSPKKVSVYLANGAVVEIPGARNGEKWGLWMDPDGTFIAKLWSEGAKFYSGVGDAEGCAPIRGTGFPRPKCELKRQNDWRESQERQARAQSISPSACVRAGGKIVDPNEGTISEDACKAMGGHALFAFGDSSMPPNSRSCVKAGEPEPLGRVRDPSAPTEVCRVTERGAVRERPLDLNNPFDKILRDIDFSGRLK